MTAKSKTTKTRDTVLGRHHPKSISEQKKAIQQSKEDREAATGAMAAAWFGTLGAGAAIERVFGAKRRK